MSRSNILLVTDSPHCSVSAAIDPFLLVSLVYRRLSMLEYSNYHLPSGDKEPGPDRMLILISITEPGSMKRWVERRVCQPETVHTSTVAQIVHAHASFIAILMPKLTIIAVKLESAEGQRITWMPEASQRCEIRC